MVNAATGISNADTITGLVSCTAANPGPLSTRIPLKRVASGATNTHGGNHSVAVDPVGNQVYMPIASTAVASGMTGICSAGGGSDSLGCIAVFQIVGSD
jgi:hypothetical protein